MGIYVFSHSKPKMSNVLFDREKRTDRHLDNLQNHEILNLNFKWLSYEYSRYGVRSVFHVSNGHMPQNGLPTEPSSIYWIYWNIDSCILWVYPSSPFLWCQEHIKFKTRRPIHKWRDCVNGIIRPNCNWIQPYRWPIVTQSILETHECCLEWLHTYSGQFIVNP